MKPKPTYQIKWDLLEEDVMAYLQHVGTVRTPTSFGFTRKPTWTEFQYVYSHLTSLWRISPMKDGFLNFAIGDCLAEGEKYFGKNKIDKWIEDYSLLLKLRDVSHLQSAGLLIYLQSVERLIKLCVSLLEGKPLDANDLADPVSTIRKKTLGLMAKKLKKAGLFISKFEERFDEFVDMRNTFVHDLWMLQSGGSKRKRFPTKRRVLETINFMKKLTRKTRYVEHVFRGLFVQILGETKGSRRKKDKLFLNYESWLKSYPMFLQNLRRIESTY